MHLTLKTEQLLADDAGNEYVPAPYVPGSERCAGCAFRTPEYSAVCDSLAGFCDDRDDGREVIWTKQPPPIDPNPL